MPHKYLLLALLCALSRPSNQSVATRGPSGSQDVHRVPASPTIEIAPGVNLPLVSLGTAEYSGAQLANITRQALALGYVGIDNDDGGRGTDLGIALRGVPRSEFFLTAKVNGGQTKAQTVAELESEHAALGVKQIDLILLHHPTPAPGLTLNATIQGQWAAIEDFFRSKRARAIGVSNFCPMAFAALFETAEITPAVNQIMYAARDRGREREHTHTHTL